MKNTVDGMRNMNTSIFASNKNIFGKKDAPIKSIHFNGKKIADYRISHNELIKGGELIYNYKIKPYVVINKSDLNAEISFEIENWCDAKGVCIAGIIPFDEKVVQAMLDCKSIVEWSPGSEISSVIKSIWETVIKD